MIKANPIKGEFDSYAMFKPHVQSQFTALSARLYSSSNTPRTSSVLASLPDSSVSEHYARAVYHSLFRQERSTKLPFGLDIGRVQRLSPPWLANSSTQDEAAEFS